MQNSDTTEKRLMELEIKASFSEDLLEQLNQTIYRQQREIDALAREIGQLKLQAQQSGGAAPRSPADDLPPHY